jgi:hypothetical protein
MGETKIWQASVAPFHVSYHCCIFSKKLTFGMCFYPLWHVLLSSFRSKLLTKRDSVLHKQLNSNGAGLRECSGQW